MSIVILWILKKRNKRRLQPVTFWLLPCSFQRQMQLKLPFLASWPWGSVLLPLRRKLGLCSPPFPQLAESKRASKWKRNTQDCSYSINRSDCTSSLVTFRLLTDAQLPASLRDSKFHCISWFTAAKRVYRDIQPAGATRTALFSK